MITSFFKPKPTGEDGNGKAKGKRGSSSSDDGGDNAAKKKAKIPLTTEVQELVDGIEKDNPWREMLDKHFRSPSFQQLAKFMKKEREGITPIFPPVKDTFSALNWTPFDQVKVVIVGQDPYHGPNQAHGLCFSVRKGVAIPPSLRNIYKELKNDDGIDNFTELPKHGYLERWAKQGVLMINNVLTVRKAQPHSHKKQGWEDMTDEIIRAVDRNNKQGVVYLLWGKPATKKTEAILRSSSPRTVICTSHPSPLGATKTKSPFIGSKCFSRANKALEEYGMEPIDWRVDGDDDDDEDGGEEE